MIFNDKEIRKTTFFIVAILISVLVMLPQLTIKNHAVDALGNIEAERHLVLDSSATESDIHTHDNGTAEEAKAYHLHDHDPSDHSHQSIDLVSHVSLHFKKGRLWCGEYRCTYILSSPFLLERPPKFILA